MRLMFSHYKNGMMLTRLSF